MSDKYRKNIEKISDMVSGDYKGKIQSGYIGEKEVERKVGDKWVDSDGVECEQRKGYKMKISKLQPRGIADTCSDCESFILKKWDKDVYKVNGRCYYCQIDFEAKFPRKFVGVKENILNQFTGDEGAKKWEALSEEEKQGVIDLVLDGKDKYIIDKLENYLEGFEKEKEIMEKEMDEEKVFDKSVANAIANSNVEMTINKNKAMNK